LRRILTGLNKNTMTKARTIAEMHYFNKSNDTVDELYRQNKIDSLEKLITKQLILSDVRKCNGKKDPNIVKTYALITRKDGLTDVWCEGECLGKGLDTDGINKLNL